MLEILGVGLILSADSFSAALAMGFRPFLKQDAIKFAFTSGLAEVIATYLGFLAGSQFVENFQSLGNWITFILLFGVSLHMAYEGLQEILSKEEQIVHLTFHSFTRILVVSFATSLDALSVGVGLGVLEKPMVPFLISIGGWAFMSTIIGLNLARKISGKLGPYMMLVGASVLMFMAIKIVVA